MLTQIEIDPEWEHARGGKTPWNPSRTATARVPEDNRLPHPEVCPYCDSSVRVKHHEEVYGMTYGDWPWMFGCTKCDATVGMHPFTNIPLGSLANSELRQRRKLAKELWQVASPYSGRNRTPAYQWLASRLGISVADCHFGRFDLDTCDHVIAICNR